MTYRLHRHRSTTTRPIKLWSMAVLVIGTVMVSMLGPVIVNALENDSPTLALPGFVINEVQTGGCIGDPCIEDTKNEFIELYNPQAVALLMNDWKVSYISASGATTTNLVVLKGVISAHGYVLLAHESYYPNADLHFGSASAGSLAKTGGHVEVKTTYGASIDRVGWGNAAHARTAPFTAPAPGKSAERNTDSSGTLIYLGDDSKDFTIQSSPTPQTGDYTATMETPILTPAPDQVPALPGVPSTPAVPVDSPVTLPVTIPETTSPSSLTCEGIIISELMPNPLGADSGHEFIELHNTTSDIVLLDGCSLQTSSNTKNFALAGISLQPGEYRAFYDSGADPANGPFTGLRLPNASGGTASLLIPGKDTLAVTYPTDMADDTVWSLAANNNWALSFTATPDAANIATPLKLCAAGQVRNPDTNHCVNQSSDAASGTSVATSAITNNTSTLAACKEGQERNPATNRCHNIVSTSVAAASAKATAAATACKVGQNRNPDTNRCRNIVATTATTAKACPTGQERNAETNRCRKITAAGSSNGKSLDGVKDVASASNSKSKPYWLIAVIALAAAIAYGVYEWRQEIMLFVSKYINLPGKLTPTQAPAK